MNKRIEHLLFKVNSSIRVKSIDHLEQGYSNDCFRVLTLEGQIYKVRIGQNNDIIDRKNEIQVLKNISMIPLYYDEKNGDGVWRWLDGNSLSKENINPTTISQISDIIKALHSKPTCLVREHDDFEYFEKFGNLLGNKNMLLYLNLIEKHSKDKKCLCHNDISLSNLIYNSSTKQLFLIDYEWSRVNNPYWDYGNFVKEADLSESQIKLFQKFSGLNLLKLYEFAIVATLYSIQLSYVFKKQTPELKKYRIRLFKQLEKYKKCIHTLR